MRRQQEKEITAGCGSVFFLYLLKLSCKRYSLVCLRDGLTSSSKSLADEKQIKSDVLRLHNICTVCIIYVCAIVH